MNAAVAYPRERRIDTRARKVTKAAPKAQPRAAHRVAALTEKGMLAIVVASVVLFSVMVGLIYTKYVIAQTQLEINALQDQIHEQMNEQTRLQEKLERAGSVSSIMERASALGMAQPTGSQILVVNIPEAAAQESMSIGGN